MSLRLRQPTPVYVKNASVEISVKMVPSYLDTFSAITFFLPNILVENVHTNVAITQTKILKVINIEIKF